MQNGHLQRSPGPAFVVRQELWSPLAPPVSGVHCGLGWGKRARAAGPPHGGASGQCPHAVAPGWAPRPLCLRGFYAFLTSLSRGLPRKSEGAALDHTPSQSPALFPTQSAQRAGLWKAGWKARASQGFPEVPEQRPTGISAKLARG